MNIIKWIGIVWASSIPLSFWIRMQNHDYVRLGDLAWMIVFGPFNTALQINDWDVILWRREKKTPEPRSE